MSKLSIEEKSKLIERIQKLFSLGDKNRNPNEGEVKSALRKAKQLMKQYNLSLSELDLEQQKEDIIQSTTKGTAYIAFWQRKLADMIGKLFNCDPIIDPRYYSRGYVFVGFKEEANLAVKCYDYLTDVIKILANLHSKNKMDFYAGITDRLQERIDKEIKLNNPIIESKCKAIVCCKEALINSYEEKNIHLENIHFREPHIAVASIDYIKGYRQGGKIDMQNRKKVK
jgi:hypothetical protein